MKNELSRKQFDILAALIDETEPLRQRQIEKNGFIRCGTIYVEDGSPRIAYHWTSKG